MGSVVPVRRGSDHAKALILEIYRKNRDAVESRGDVDLDATVALLDRALSDPDTHQHMLYAVADLLCGVLGGVALDPSTWEPPRPPLTRN